MRTQEEEKKEQKQKQNPILHSIIIHNKTK